MRRALGVLSLLVLAVREARGQTAFTTLQTTYAAPFFLPQQLQGQVAPQVVVPANVFSASPIVPTPTFTGLYSVAWPGYANSQNLLVTSNPSSLVATQTQIAYQGAAPATTLWTCVLQGQATCVAADAFGNANTQTEQLLPFTTIAVQLESVSTILPSTTDAPSSSSLSLSSSTPSLISTGSITDTRQPKSSNVFVGSPSGATSMLAGSPLLSTALTLFVGAVVAAVVLL